MKINLLKFFIIIMFGYNFNVISMKNTILTLNKTSCFYNQLMNYSEQDIESAAKLLGAKGTNDLSQVKNYKQYLTISRMIDTPIGLCWKDDNGLCKTVANSKPETLQHIVKEFILNKEEKKEEDIEVEISRHYII